MYRPTKTILFQLVIAVVTVIALAISGYSQERFVSIDLELPMKRTLTAEDFKLGGSVRVPLTDRITVNGSLAFKDALNQFLTPADQITAAGEMWFYFAPNNESSIRPFVFGGMEQNMITSDIPDSSNGIAGFGVHYIRPTGFQMIPKFRFTTKDFTDGFQSLGQRFGGSVEFIIPVGKYFRIGAEPYVERKEFFANTGFYQTVYGGRVKLIRVF